MVDSSGVPERELLRDSEATLRQIRGLLRELGAGEGPDLHDTGAEGTARSGGDPGDGSPGTGLTDLLAILARTHGEIVEVVSGLRRSRGILEEASVERLKRTHAKLREVSSATEVAATGMLDGLDRSLGLVDRLDALSEAGSRVDTEEGQEVRDTLREELHSVISLLQFQDITAQQLGYASSVLEDLEFRLLAIAELFERMGLSTDMESARSDETSPDDGPDSSPGATEVTCDPGASTMEAESRQAVADEIFT